VKILLVDDDATLLRFLGEFLERQGYQVFTADRGAAALPLFYEQHPDLVVLDVMMPGMDGWEVCARIRELSPVPIILVTAKTAEADKLRGFRLGIDDYVTKPFSLAELGARVQAVLARTADQRAREAQAVQIGRLEIDFRRHEARRDGRAMDLTPTEFRLLAALGRGAGAAVSHAALAQEVWGGERRGAGSALRRYIWLLRQKLEAEAPPAARLVTVRGFGYRLEP
jgi:DNA-binding response OmpR family regulator